jgi:hypothetical protein
LKYFKIPGTHKASACFFSKFWDQPGINLLNWPAHQDINILFFSEKYLLGMHKVWFLQEAT